MFSKKFISIFVLVSIIIGILLSFMRNNYIFDNITNAHVKQLNDRSYTYNKFEEVKNEYKEKFLILNDSEEDSEKIKNNFNTVIKDMDYDLESKDINEFYGETFGYKAIIINSEDLSNFLGFYEIIEYANAGGTIIFANRPLTSNNFLNYKDYFGIEEVDGLTEANDMEVLTNIIIKGIGLKRIGDVENSSLDVTLSKDSKVHIIAEDEVPLLWEKAIGKGKVFFVNGQILSDKSNRGVLSGIVSNTGDSFIYPIINSKVLFLDDFPAPIPNKPSKIIYDEYEMDDYEFFINVWWPDMVKTFNKYNIKPTGLIIYNYEDLTNNIENFDGSEYTENVVVQGRNLLKVGGELGIHGFNHQPLTREKYENDELGYKSWNEFNEMVKAQVALREFIEDVYPNYQIKAYVPPSNIISEEGIKALRQGFPNVNTIASLYVADEKSLAYEQEFSKEDGIYNFPRYSSGYGVENIEKWSMYNGLTTNGVFSHFIHPDDILDPDRGNGMTWKELNGEFTKLVGDNYKNFSWLQSHTISEGVKALDNYINTESVFDYTNNNIKGYLKNSTKNDYFILRTNNKIAKSEGCTYEKIDDNVYLVHSDDVEFSINFKGIE